MSRLLEPNHPNTHLTTKRFTTHAGQLPDHVRTVGRKHVRRKNGAYDMICDLGLLGQVPHAAHAVAPGRQKKIVVRRVERDRVNHVCVRDAPQAMHHGRVSEADGAVHRRGRQQVGRRKLQM